MSERKEKQCNFPQNECVCHVKVLLQEEKGGACINLCKGVRTRYILVEIVVSCAKCLGADVKAQLCRRIGSKHGHLGRGGRVIRLLIALILVVLGVLLLVRICSLVLLLLRRLALADLLDSIALAALLACWLVVAVIVVAHCSDKSTEGLGVCGIYYCCRCPQMASVNWLHVAEPPRSRVRTFPSEITLNTAA